VLAIPGLRMPLTVTSVICLVPWSWKLHCEMFLPPEKPIRALYQGPSVKGDPIWAARGSCWFASSSALRLRMKKVVKSPAESAAVYAATPRIAPPNAVCSMGFKRCQAEGADVEAAAAAIARMQRLGVWKRLASPRVCGAGGASSMALTRRQ
jgi:hypothetical protein